MTTEPKHYGEAEVQRHDEQKPVAQLEHRKDVQQGAPFSDGSFFSNGSGWAQS